MPGQPPRRARTVSAHSSLDFDEMNREAARLAAALGPAGRRTVCLKCLSRFLKLNPTHRENVQSMRATSGALFTALMAFVTEERSTSLRSRMALTVQLVQNRARCTVCPPWKGEKDVHKLRKRLEDEQRDAGDDVTIFDEMLGLAIETLAALLLGLESYWSRDKTFGSRRGPWPATVEDLFPHGSRQSIASLCAWYNCRPCEWTANLLRALLCLHRPLTLKELHLDSNRTTLIDGFIRAFDTFNALHTQGGFTAPPANLLANLCGIDLLLLTIHAGQDWEYGDSPTFLAGRAGDLFRAMFPFLDVMHSSHMLPRAAQIIAGHIYELVPAPERGPRPAFLAPKGPTLDEDDPYHALRRWMPWKRRECCGPGCALKVHHSATGRAFARCARCRLVQYCSKECQRRDWASEDVAYPHRELCDILQELMLFTRAEMDVDTFVAACRANSFPVERARTIVDWQIAVRLNKGMRFYISENGAE